MAIQAPNFGPLSPPPRLLCGPGPGNADPRVLSVMSLPEVGHLDPFFLTMMDEVKALLRYAWQTNNELTLPISGTGSAAMEACFANLIEAGDKVLIFVNGYFGLRMADMAGRYDADVKTVEKPWGEVFSVDEIKTAIEAHKPAVVGLVHAETSTGACQPMEGVGQVCRDNNALLILDTVTSLSGVPLFIDKWLVDASYSGTQKCLSCPPGVSPLTFNSRAMDKLKARKGKVKNWYLDMNAIAAYLVAASPGGARVYHHTAPISMCYAIRECLRIVADEGLEARWARHASVADEFWSGLEKMGLKCHVPRENRLPTLTTVCIPEGVDGKQVCVYLRTKYNIEIGGGLGSLAGKVWRVGLMGYNARSDVVVTLLSALREALSVQGYNV
eukprot:Rmarinus@m.23486